MKTTEYIPMPLVLSEEMKEAIFDSLSKDPFNLDAMYERLKKFRSKPTPDLYEIIYIDENEKLCSVYKKELKQSEELFYFYELGDQVLDIKEIKKFYP